MTLRLTEDQLDQAVSILQSGNPVAIPTETVYGLAAPIFDEKAIKKIFSLKKRPQDNPLIAHVSSIEMVASIAESYPPIFHRLVDSFWPGPLTIVLNKKQEVPAIVSGGQNTIAVRMPSHPVALRLIDLVGSPLVAPSANLSGKPSPTSAEHVLEDFGTELKAVIDGGPCEIGLESTVLSFISEKLTLLRPGSITKEQIESVLGMDVALPEKNSPVQSPGMKYRHYAPKGAVYLVETLPSCLVDAFVLSREPIERIKYRKLDETQLYAHLREADRIGAQEIWVVIDLVTNKQAALMNRLLKAASKS